MRGSIHIPEIGTKELRKGRFSNRNHIYHVTTSTADRQALFHSLSFGRAVVHSMMREDAAGHTRTLAFVVMPDHLHWLFQLLDIRTLSVSVNTMKSFAARKINSMTRRRGAVWQRGFYDRAIRKEEDLASVARYIVANPLRAGIAKSVREYSLWDAVWV